MMRRIFRFDEASLNSSSSSSNIASPSSSSSFGTSSTGILNPTNQSTTTIGDFSLRSSSTQVDGSVSSILNNHGIFEGLDPTTSTTFENIADHLRGEIFESVQKVFKNHCSDENKLLAITENLHNDDDNTGFLGEILEHLKDKQGEHYDFALKQFNVIVGGTPPTITSPLEQFEIIPLIPMKIGNLYFSFTNPSLFMLLTLSLVLLLVYFVTKNMKKMK